MKKISIKRVLDMESLQWIPELEEFYFYNGLIEYAAAAALPLIGGAMSFVGGLFGHHGPSAQDKAIAKDDYQFMQTLQNEQNTQFINEQESQKAIQDAWNPIIKGGAYQYGFSTAEDQNLQSQIENAGATATENSVAAQQLREQQQSGGAAVMPSGAQAAIEAQQREVGAQFTAARLGEEKELGYQVGRENFKAATGAEQSVAELANPTGYASAAEAASQNALASQKNIDTQNANSLTSKLLGGIAGGFNNLDTTGSSTPAEQAANFGKGLGG